MPRLKIAAHAGTMHILPTPQEDSENGKHVNVLQSVRLGAKLL